MIDGLAIRVHAALAGAESDLETPGLAGYAFGRFAWLQAWHATLGKRDAVEVAIAVVADTRVRMVLPLGIIRQGGMRVLMFLGAPVTDYNAPLVEPTFAAALDAAAMQALWARILEAMPSHDVIRLLAMPETLDAPEGATAPAVPNPLARLAGVLSSGLAQSLRLPESSVALRRGMRPGFVSDTRRRLRRLAEVGPVSLRVADDDPTMREVLIALKRMKSRRWLDTGGPDAFGDPAFAGFYDAMGSMAIPDGRVHGTLFTVGDTPVAAHLGLVYRGRFYYLMLGWEGEEWLRFSPGRLMVDALIDAAIQDGSQVFDFTVGDESYKHEWVDTELPLLRLETAATRRGAAVLATVRMWHHARAGAKRITWLRAVVRRLAGRKPLQPNSGGRA